MVFVYLDTMGNKFDICNEIPMGFFYVRKNNLFALDSLLLGLILFFIWHLDYAFDVFTFIDSVVRGCNIPSYDLTIESSADQYVWILRVEF
jgi:hypothetical protein